MNNNKIHRYLLLIPCLTLFFACSQAEDNPQSDTTDSATAPVTQTQTEKSKAETETSQAHDHEHTAAPNAGAGWVEIESQMSCEQPVVMEFFAYQCPHCNKLEPYAEKWQLAHENVKFVGIPSHLGHKEFGSTLLVHEAAKNLGVLGMASPMLFDRIHKERKLFASEQEAIDFLVAAGANADEAKAALNDQEKIQNGINQNFDIMQKYKITGVPTVIVNHKYKTDVTIAGGYDKVFEQVDKMLALPSDCAAK